MADEWEVALATDSTTSAKRTRDTGMADEWEVALATDSTTSAKRTRDTGMADECGKWR